MATPIQKPGLPTFHHMNQSQSQRVLWLLEELGIDYNLVNHTRTPGFRAPPGMKSISSIGKAPIFLTSDGRVIIESSAIITYILRTYDTSHKFESSDWIQDEILTSFSGATLGPTTTIELIFDIVSKHTPWPLVYIARAVRRGMQNSTTKAEFASTLSWLEKELGEGEWFNGGTPGRADFMLSWPMDLIHQRGYVDFEKEYPGIAAWRKRIEGREAWKKGLEKGNGYDLSVW